LLALDPSAHDGFEGILAQLVLLDPDDAKMAEELAEWLTRERDKFTGWYLLAKYCSNDLCMLRR